MGPSKCLVWSFPGHLCIFSVFFLVIFGAQPGVGDLVFFSYFFRISGLGGFCALYEPDGITKIIRKIRIWM